MFKYKLEIFSSIKPIKIREINLPSDTKNHFLAFLLILERSERLPMFDTEAILTILKSKYPGVSAGHLERKTSSKNF